MSLAVDGDTVHHPLRFICSVGAIMMSSCELLACAAGDADRDAGVGASAAALFYDHVAMHFLFQSSFECPNDAFSAEQLSPATITKSPYCRDVIARSGQRGCLITATALLRTIL